MKDTKKKGGWGYTVEKKSEQSLAHNKYSQNINYQFYFYEQIEINVHNFVKDYCLVV